MKICHDWIRLCTAANIPLYKTDNPVLRKFLEDNVANGGSIPKCSQLRDRYLFDVYEAERTELKSLVRGKKVALIADELSDEEGRYVLNVMAVLPVTSLTLWLRILRRNLRMSQSSSSVSETSFLFQVDEKAGFVTFYRMLLEQQAQ